MHIGQRKNLFSLAKGIFTLPVNILVHFSGHVKVDDGRHLRDVETAGCYGRGHEQRPLTGLKVVQHLLTFTLQPVTYKHKQGYLMALSRSRSPK